MVCGECLSAEVVSQLQQKPLQSDKEASPRSATFGRVSFEALQLKGEICYDAKGLDNAFSFNKLTAEDKVVIVSDRF